MEDDGFWSPQRIEHLLRSWTMLDPVSVALASRSTSEPNESYHYAKRADTDPNWVLVANILCAIEAQLLELQRVDPLLVIVIWRVYVLDEPKHFVATVTGCGLETISRYCYDGLETIALRLGWTGDPASWREQQERRRADEYEVFDAVPAFAGAFLCGD